MIKSIQPNLWGPHAWKFLHYISLGYPDNPTESDKRNYKNFYYSLQDILPCEKCALNYQQNISEHPIDNFLVNKDTLMRWVIDIHNKVNKELNKNELNYEEATNLYMNDNDNQIINYCIKIIFIIMILYLLYVLYKNNKLS